MRKISFFIIFLLSFVQFVQAESFTKADADKAYQENKYAEAIKMYENILATQGESAVVYYNLGNSYFKEKNMAKGPEELAIIRWPSQYFRNSLLFFRLL